MKQYYRWMLGALLLFPSLVFADIQLPQDLHAKASVTRGSRDGVWEKTLIVQFPERRRVLSTTDGFVDSLAAINHAAHPELWMKVHEDMQTRHEIGGNVYVRKIQKKIADSLGVKSEDEDRC
ncbi:MAG: hypothetical protein PHD01_11080 [Geobacteraceae bacterium]|nr:hypothetical protein [Geobacteraceae bacterium]